jgi:hypothetical protein
VAGVVKVAGLADIAMFKQARANALAQAAMHQRMTHYGSSSQISPEAQAEIDNYNTSHGLSETPLQGGLDLGQIGSGHMTAQLNATDLLGTGLESKLAALAMGKLGSLGLVGATAWHASPHLFDKFEHGFVGTGEGAQAYGHGVAYLAENPAVSGKGGVYDNAFTKSHGAPANIYKTDIPDAHIDKMIDWDKPFSEQSEYVKNALQSGMDKANDLRNQAKSLPNTPEYEDQYQNLLNQFKPFEAFPSILNPKANPTGEKIYEILKNEHQATTRPHDQVDSSNTLQQIGIKGIKYLDGSSRTAGEGTRNFVMFNPEDIRILERNGVATGQQPWDGKAMSVPAKVPYANAISKAREVQDASNHFDINQEINNISQEGNIDVSHLVNNPKMWDSENEQFTDFGQSAYQDALRNKAVDNLRLPDIKEIGDLNNAHRDAQYEAMKSILEEKGIPYNDTSSAHSKYLEVGGKKIRFADHPNMVKDSAVRGSLPIINVSPTEYKFSDALNHVESLERNGVATGQQPWADDLVSQFKAGQGK